MSLNVLDRYEPVIGLEVHCQLKAQTKLFCRCATKFGALPNHHTCPICLGLPGALPVLNKQAIDYAIRFALAVEAEVHPTSIFSRKQYFYPDLPKGYQISQYDKPYCTEGKLKLQSGTTVRIQRAHLEEDAGKNVHAQTSSYVDLNRAGIPLIEIVTHPDIRNPEDAADYLKRLRSLVRHLDICDGNLEEGSFRCDVNISLRKKGVEKFGTRCEIKNLNSFKNIERAIRYEMTRQADVLDSGGTVHQMTLLFDAASGKTSPMRSKADSQDYRYFPEPDLKPLVITPERIALVKKNMPELPEAMATRFAGEFGLSEYDARILTSDRDLAEYFEHAIKRVGNAAPHKIVANWMISELLREVNNREWDLGKIPITSEQLGDLVILIGKGTISGKIAKTVFEDMVESAAKGVSADPNKIVKEKGLLQVSDTSAIAEVVKKVVEAHPKEVQEFLAGRDRVFGFFVGQVMKLGAGKFNPGIVNDLLKAELNAKKV